MKKFGCEPVDVKIEHIEEPWGVSVDTCPCCGRTQSECECSDDDIMAATKEIE